MIVLDGVFLLKDTLQANTSPSNASGTRRLSCGGRLINGQQISSPSLSELPILGGHIATTFSIIDSIQVLRQLVNMTSKCHAFNI